MRSPIVIALRFLVTRSRNADRLGAMWCAQPIEREITDLTRERDEARAQVVADRAELDGYRNQYGPLPGRGLSVTGERMSA